MIFRVSGRGRASASGRRGRRLRPKMAVARLGEAGSAPRRRRTFFLWVLLLRSRRALARLREYYGEMMKRLIAEAATLEPVRGKGAIVDAAAAAARSAVVPAVVARTVLSCNSHYYVR